jgi:hypothetical protein
MTLPERASLTWQGVDRVCLREDRTYRDQVLGHTTVAEEVAQGRAEATPATS